jgi:hypothetical protein
VPAGKSFKALLPCKRPGLAQVAAPAGSRQNRAVGRPPTAAFAALALCLAGCLNMTPPGTVFSTTPAGAMVVVEGRDSGFVTPCQLHLERDEDQRVELRLAGFQPVRIVLHENEQYWVIPWSKGVASSQAWHFPLFLEYTDFFLPIRRNSGHQPGRVHVRLKPALEEAPR